MRKFLEIPFHKTEFKDFYDENGGAKRAITSISNFFVRQRGHMAKPLFTARSKEAENIPNTKKMENDIFVVL